MIAGQPEKNKIPRNVKKAVFRFFFMQGEFLKVAIRQTDLCRWKKVTFCAVIINEQTEVKHKGFYINCGMHERR